MDWNTEIRRQLADHWRDRLLPRLAGLGDDEYFWEPVAGAWTVRRVGDDDEGRPRFASDRAIPPPDPEPVTTIAWRLHHLCALLELNRPLHGGPSVHWTDVTPPAGTADEAVARLDDRVGEWLAGVASLGDAGLEAPLGGDWTVGGMVLHNHREVIHHGAEVALLRDLHRAR